MCVSPYPHVRASPTNACLYWIGRFDGVRFDMETARGEFRCRCVGCMAAFPCWTISCRGL